MGITGLWAHLKGQGRNCVQTLEGEELVRHVDGQVVAIDAATWLVQAATERSYDHELKHIKTVFERASHFLRMGVLPVLVFEGAPPPEKAATFMRRYGYRLNSSAATDGGFDSAFRRMVSDSKELLAAMGLPVVQAPGEAEATCALLDRLGLVDAVASEDADALLYGARRLYKGMRLHTELHRKHHTAEWVEQAAVAAALGLEGSEVQMEEAMVAMALISGADYLVDGIKSHGPAAAAEVVQALLRRQRRAQEEESGPGPVSGLLDLLRVALAAPVDDALLASNSKCSTCRRCRHGATGKLEHGKHGCEECGTHPPSKGGTGDGGCLPLASPDEPCPCGPCSRRDDRLLHGLAKAAAGAHAGGIRAFLQRFDAARGAYEKVLADQTVLRALPPFKWERLNYGELKRLLHRVYARDKNVARKILPLLLEYDARYVGKAVGADLAVMGPEDLVEAEALGFLFVPTEIRRPCGRGGSRGGGSGWRYEMKVRPVGEGIHILAEAATGVEGAAMPQPPPAPCSTEAAERYDRALAAVAKEVLSEGRASLRMSLVETEYPALVRAYKAAEERMKQKPPAKPQKPKPKASRNTKGEGEGKGKGKGTTLLDFFSEDAAASASPSPSPSASTSASSASFAAEPADLVVGTPVAAAQPAPSLSSCSPIEILTPPSPLPDTAAERGAPVAFSTPVHPPRPSLRTPGAPAKPKRSISPWQVDGEEDEDDEDGFGSGAMQNLNARFKRARSGDGEEGESSVVDLTTSTRLSHIAEEGGGAEGTGGAEAQDDDDEEEGEEEEIVADLSLVPRVGAGAAARGRGREVADVVDLTTP